MQKISLILALLFFTASCKKTVNSPEVAEQFNFDLPYTMNIYVKQGGSTVLPLDFTLISGKSEVVSLSLSGVPSKTTCSFTSATGKPPFSSSIQTAASADMQPGIYPLTLTVTSETAGKKVYYLSLVVVNPNERAMELAGFYYENEYYQDSMSEQHIVSIGPYFYSPATACVYNFAKSDVPVLLYLDFSDNTFVSPVNQAAAWACGYGTFTDSTITFYFNTTTNSHRYTAVLRRK